MSDLMKYLERAVSGQASDLFLVAGGPVSAKMDGHIRPISDTRLLPPDTKELITDIYSMADRSMDIYMNTGDDDFSFAVPGLSCECIQTAQFHGCSGPCCLL